MESPLFEVSAMNLQEWVDTRGMLNHYLLMNRVLNVLFSISQDGSHCKAEVALIDQWATRQQEYEHFFNSAVDVLSAAHIFDDTPLAKEICQDDLAAWRSFAHQIYLGGTGIEHKIAAMNDLLHAAVGLAAELSAAKSASDRRKIADELRHCAAQLSGAISALPSNVVSIISPLD